MVHTISSIFWALTISVALIGGISTAAAQTKVENGVLYVEKKKADIHSNCTRTNLTTVYGGKTYPVYVTDKSGAAFIFVTSKAGNEYRRYLGKEASDAVAKATNK